MNNLKKILIVSLFVSQVLLLFACRKENGYATESILNQTTLDKIEALETENNIIINYCDVPIEDEIDGEYVLSSNAEEIEKAVEAAEIIFSRLPEDWAKNIANIEKENEGLERVEEVCIVFCQETKKLSLDKDREYALGADVLVSGQKLYLFADVHNFDPKVSLVRAFFAGLYIKSYNDSLLIETNQIKENGEENYKSLNDVYKFCNPEEFEYTEEIKEIDETFNQYLYQDDNTVENVYFVCEEAMYAVQLDYVLTMSPLLYTDEGEELPPEYTSRHVIEKAFQTVWSTAYVFDTVDVYWYRMIQEVLGLNV